MGDLEFEFTATVIEWRGPAPFYYAVVPREESAAIGTPPSDLSEPQGAIALRDSDNWG